MGINIGNSVISKVYVGSSVIKEIYIGSDRVWSSAPYHVITWKNHDGTILNSGRYQEGSMPEYQGDTPTKEATSKYTYQFNGWSPTVTKVTKDATYTATYKETELPPYTITWTGGNEDDITTEVEANVIPKYPDDAPKRTKSSDEYYDYTFSSWYPTPVRATVSTTYVALFNKKLKEGCVKVTWEGISGNVLQTVIYNSKVESEPVYSGTTPVKSSDKYYDYTFEKWDAGNTAGTNNVVYKPIFAQSTRYYNVIWKNYDGTILASESYEYNQGPSYKGEEPYRAADDNYLYAFTGWSPSISPVTKDANYTAQYKSNRKGTAVEEDSIVCWSNNSNAVIVFEITKYNGSLKRLTVQTDGFTSTSLSNLQVGDVINRIIVFGYTVHQLTDLFIDTERQATAYSSNELDPLNSIYRPADTATVNYTVTGFRDVTFTARFCENDTH